MTETTALGFYADEWSRMPQMATGEMWQRVTDQLHAEAEQRFGKEAAEAAWQQFRTNKGWKAA